MMFKRKHLFIIALNIGWVLLGCSSSQAAGVSIDLDGGTSLTSRIIQLTALITILSVAPSILVMLTSFTRIIVALSLLRSALGLQQSPPNSVLTSLALFLTLFIMTPTLEKSFHDGIEPYLENRINETQALEQTTTPIKQFMLANVRKQDLSLFFDIAKIDSVEGPEETPMRVLIPAFMISELKRGFEIGFLIFIPFLIIDMVVASILMSMGMMMVPPVMIAMPFKIIFFVLVDGWRLVSGSLIQGFSTP